MKLDDFLQRNKLKLYPWARAHGISPEAISLFRTGRRSGLSVRTVAKIVAATNGEVTYEDLVNEILERKSQSSPPT